MNTWQIVGGFVSILGTILMFYGSYQQGRGDKEFQNTVGGFVEKHQIEDAPEIVALNVEKKDNDYFLTVQNIGRKPATNIKVLFLEESTPDIFSNNLISGAQEIPQNTKFTFRLNIFTGINMVLKLPNSDPGYREDVKKALLKFNAGEMVFIPRFHIEYYHGQKRITTPKHYLVLEKHGDLIYFGKDH